MGDSTSITLSLLALVLFLLWLLNVPVEIVDGDTFRTFTGEWVRLVDIDAPEKGEPMFQAAKSFLESHVLWKPVILLRVGKDKYGRTLAYVFYPLEFINYELVKAGLASPYIIEEHPLSDLILSAFSDAPFCLRVDVHPNAPGNDWENLEGEWIRLKNRCPKPFDGNVCLDLGEMNICSTIELNYLEAVFIVTGCGNGEENIYICSKKPLLRNDGGCVDVYLNGALYARRCWGNV